MKSMGGLFIAHEQAPAVEIGYGGGADFSALCHKFIGRGYTFWLRDEDTVGWVEASTSAIGTAWQAMRVGKADALLCHPENSPNWAFLEAARQRDALAMAARARRLSEGR